MTYGGNVELKSILFNGEIILSIGLSADKKNKILESNL